jgi:hypothetical protein
MDWASWPNWAVTEVTMISSREDWRATEASAEYQREHWRTHRRWVATVLALYGGLVSIGIIATVIHGATLSSSSRPAVEASLEKAAR